MTIDDVIEFNIYSLKRLLGGIKEYYANLQNIGMIAIEENDPNDTKDEITYVIQVNDPELSFPIKISNIDIQDHIDNIKDITTLYNFCHNFTEVANIKSDSDEVTTHMLKVISATIESIDKYGAIFVIVNKKSTLIMRPTHNIDKYLEEAIEYTINLLYTNINKENFIKMKKYIYSMIQEYIMLIAIDSTPKNYVQNTSNILN